VASNYTAVLVKPECVLSGENAISLSYLVSLAVDEQLSSAFCDTGVHVNRMDYAVIVCELKLNSSTVRCSHPQTSHSTQSFPNTHA
jgi:hypothetical protein